MRFDSMHGRGSSSLALGCGEVSRLQSAGGAELRHSTGDGAQSPAAAEPRLSQSSVEDLCTPPGAQQSSAHPQQAPDAAPVTHPTPAEAASCCRTDGGQSSVPSAAARVTTCCPGATSAASLEAAVSPTAPASCYNSTGIPVNMLAALPVEQQPVSSRPHLQPSSGLRLDGSSARLAEPRLRPVAGSRWASVNAAARNHGMPAPQQERSRRQWGTLTFQPTRLL